MTTDELGGASHQLHLMNRSEYTALASSSDDEMATDEEQHDDDWHLIKTKHSSQKEDCNDNADTALPKGPSASQEQSQVRPLSPENPSAEEAVKAPGSNHHQNDVTNHTSETTSNKASDPASNAEPEGGWNAYLRKGAVAAVGGTMVGVGLVMIPLPTPFGAVIASSGLAVLGTEFEGAKEMNDTLIATTQDKLEQVRFRVEEKLSKGNTPKFLSKTFLPFVKRKPSQSESSNSEGASNTLASDAPAMASSDHEPSKDVDTHSVSDSPDFASEKTVEDTGSPTDEPK